MVNSPLGNPNRRGRETNRKRLIRDVLESMYRGRAVLLDELRWAVMGPRLSRCLDENARRSVLNNFARTIREQVAEHLILKVPVSPNTPVGLIARAAVYRVRNVAALRRFLNAAESCILCRCKTNLEVEEPRYQSWSRYVAPQHHGATFRFFESRPSKNELRAVAERSRHLHPGNS